MNSYHICFYIFAERARQELASELQVAVELQGRLAKALCRGISAVPNIDKIGISLWPWNHGGGKGNCLK